MRLRNPAYYNGRTEDGFPLQTQLPERVTMPVFSAEYAALKWMDAYSLRHSDYEVKSFYTLEDVEPFASSCESGYQHGSIKPTPDPNIPPKIHPFGRLMEMARSEAE